MYLRSLDINLVLDLYLVLECNAGQDSHTVVETNVTIQL
jgi:hypothetical protein